MPRLESAVERELGIRARAAGGLSIKLTGYKYVPDRLILLPRRVCYFAELKSDNGALEPGQELYHDTLRKLGFPVAVINSYELLDLYLPRR